MIVFMDMDMDIMVKQVQVVEVGERVGLRNDRYSFSYTAWSR